MHRAGAALAVIATFLRARECQPLAQEIEERRARVDCDRSPLAIDGQRHDACCVTACGRVGPTYRPGKHASVSLTSAVQVSGVESRMGAVAWGLRPSPRFPSPLIKPDVPISGIRLSDRLHRNARDGTALGRR